jgi:hypothetical protein
VIDTGSLADLRSRLCEAYASRDAGTGGSEGDGARESRGEKPGMTGRVLLLSISRGLG